MLLLCFIGIYVLEYSNILTNQVCRELVKWTLGGGLYILVGWFLPRIRNLKLMLVISICSLGLSYVFRYLNLPFHELVGAIGFVYLALYTSNFKIPFATLPAREVSKWIYFTHVYFIMIFYKEIYPLLEIYNIHLRIIDITLLAIITLSCYFLYKLSCKTYGSSLRKLV